MVIPERAAAPGHVLLTMRALNRNRYLLPGTANMRAARAIVSLSTVAEPVAPALPADAIGDNAHCGEGWV